MIRKSAILFLFLFVSAAAFAESGKTSLPYKEFIFEPGNLGPSHSPSIVELPGGELFAVWYAPTVWTEKAVIWGSRKLPGAKSWTEPSIIQYAGGYSNKNPVIYLNRDNKLLLFWGDEKRFFRWPIDRVWMKVSEDLGRTWGPARNLRMPIGFLPRTHLLTLHNGWVIFPVYWDLCTSSAVATSKDGGLTWEKPRFLLYFFGIQPTIIQRSDMSLFALTRTGMPPRLSWQAVSHDLGKNWTGQRVSTVKNPGSSIEMVKLKSGNVVLAFNDSKTDRSSLSLALSCDEGMTWPYVKVIEHTEGSVNIYPSVMQDRDGLIHVLYSYDTRQSIAHFVTDERWIKSVPVIK